MLGNPVKAQLLDQVVQALVTYMPGEQGVAVKAAVHSNTSFTTETLACTCSSLIAYLSQVPSPAYPRTRLMGRGAPLMAELQVITGLCLSACRNQQLQPLNATIGGQPHQQLGQQPLTA